jgi:LysM repeat protein
VPSSNTTVPTNAPALGNNAGSNAGNNAGANPGLVIVTATPANQAPASNNAAAAPPTTAGNTTGNTGGAAACTPPAGWVAYTVQNGDSLGVLAQQTNVTAQQIATANCLANPDVIEAGQVIYLPTAIVSGSGNSGANNSNPIPTAANSNGKNVTPSTGPTIQNVWVEPAIVENSQYVVSPGASVTLKAGTVTNAVKVTFMMLPVGSTAAPKVIGVDTNLADGVAVPWTVPASLQANVWAVATNSANESTQSPPIVVFTR